MSDIMPRPSGGRADSAQARADGAPYSYSPYSSPKTVKWVSLRSLKEFVRVDCVLSATAG